VAQRGRDGIQRVGSSDKEYFGEVIFQLQIVIGKAVILLRIQYFQQGGGGVTAIVGAHFVYLVKHHNRVIGLRFLDRTQDTSRQSADIGTAVTANFGFVMDAAQAKALKLTIQRAGDRFSE